MPHFQDQETLTRILGMDPIPNDILEECDLRTSMFHKSGASGPMGALAMISLVRDLGYKPASQAERSAKTEWRELPQDGSVRIEAGPFFGTMQPGTFLGFVQAGMLAVKLDEDDFVREVRADMVKLAADQRKPAEGSEDAAVPDARINLIEKRPLARKAEAVELPEEPITFEDPADQEFNWAYVDIDSKVWVDFEGDQVDAKFKGVSDDGKLEVVLKGKKKSQLVEASLVTFSG